MEKRWLSFFLIVFAILALQRLLFPPPPPVAKPAETAETAETANPVDTPAAADNSRTGEESRSLSTRRPAESVDDGPEERAVVETRKFRIEFTSRGAIPLTWEIVDPDYLVPIYENSLSHDTPTTRGLDMVAQYGAADSRDFPLQASIREKYMAVDLAGFSLRNYRIERSEEDGAHVLRFVSPEVEDGLQLIKTVTIPEDGFMVRVRQELINHSDQIRVFESDGHGPGLLWGGGLGGEPKTKQRSGGYGLDPAAVWLIGAKTNNIPQKDLDPGRSTTVAGSPTWAGLTNHYFFAALLPVSEAAALRVSAAEEPTIAPGEKKARVRQSIGVFQPELRLAPGESSVQEFEVFVGPKSKRVLQEFDRNLDEVFFYSSWRWFRALCMLLMSFLNWLHDYTRNYGWAIVSMTLAIRLVTQPLVHFGMKSNARFMQAQQKLKPELDEIMKKHKDNPQKRNEETWKLYKKHNVNPLGAMKGCFWMLIQMPIFIALYRLLDASIELRGSTFLWIDDLSRPDRLFSLPAGFPFIDAFNLLPILMTVSQFGATKLSMSKVQDPNQKMMMYFMPVFFMFIMYNFSSGLVLYWFVSNLWQIGSQVWINRIVAQEAAHGEKSPPPANPVAVEAPSPDAARKRRKGR